jgi:hypothetical protein
MIKRYVAPPMILEVFRELSYLKTHRKFRVPNELYPFIHKKTFSSEVLQKHISTWLPELYAHKDSFSESSIKWIQDLTLYCYVDKSFVDGSVEEIIYYPCQIVNGDLYLSVLNWLMVTTALYSQQKYGKFLKEFCRVANKTGLFQKLFQVFVVKQILPENQTLGFLLQHNFSNSVTRLIQILSSDKETKQLAEAMNGFIREFFLCHYSHPSPYLRRAAIFAVRTNPPLFDLSTEVSNGYHEDF